MIEKFACVIALSIFITAVRSQDVVTYKSCGAGKECVPHWVCSSGQSAAVQTETGSCEYLEVCCNTSDKQDIPENVESKAQIPEYDTATGCGYRNIAGIDQKITNSVNSETQFAEFPWMVAVLREEGAYERIYECGGSIIAPNVILTAAQCVQGGSAGSYYVRAGEWDVSSTKELLPHVDVRVKEIVLHPEFKSESLWNAIALLVLETPLTFQAHIRPICLTQANAQFDFSQCYATGWGKDEFGNAGKYQVILKKVSLPLMPSDECQKKLRTTRLGLYFELHDSFICAGGVVGQDTCRGDGGSPLVCPIAGANSRYYQIGMVAWGIGCGEEGIPGVYVNVPHFRQWINEQLTARHIDTRYFIA